MILESIVTVTLRKLLFHFSAEYVHIWQNEFLVGVNYKADMILESIVTVTLRKLPFHFLTEDVHI